MYNFKINVIVMSWHALLIVSNANALNNNISYIAPELSVVTITSVGDIFIHQSILDAVYDNDTKTFNFEACFEEIAPYLLNSDISTAWFGGVLDSTGPYTGYPSFKTPQSLASTLKDAGLGVLFRTNHTMDYGEQGLKSTTTILNKYNIEQIGAYISEERSKNIYVFNKNGLRISFLSYTYGMNDIPVIKSWMVNFIDTVKIKNDISRARQISDFIIVALHFGNEYERYPNQEQKQTTKTIANAGADLIIGSHPHVIQPVDMIDKKVFVAYSLGNFFCGQRMRYCDAGVILKYTIAKEKDNVYLKEVKYTPTWTAKYIKDDKYKFKILPLTKSTMITKENYHYLLNNNIARMKESYHETVEHIDKPDIGFTCEE